jgi:hypothetical protein
MHLRSNKNSLSMLSIDNKVHKKTIRKTPIVKNVLVKELKPNTNKNVSYSIELSQMELIKTIEIFNEYIYASRILDTIEITDFETMSFVCPELDFWKCQF